MAVEQQRRRRILWTAINELALPEENPLRWAAGRTSMPFRKVDWARRIRNTVGPRRPISQRDITRAASGRPGAPSGGRRRGSAGG